MENAFGILASRFRLLLRPIEVNASSAQKIVWAACILHNYLRQHAGNDYIRTSDVDFELPEGQVIPAIWRDSDLGLRPLPRHPQKNATTYAKNVREGLANYFISRDGELPWQYSSI